MNGGMRNRTEQGNILLEIDQISFVLDELRLFLDTHPSDASALALFDENMRKREELVNTYTQKYGPLNAYYININDTWDWTNSPMPWDVEAN